MKEEGSFLRSGAAWAPQHRKAPCFFRKSVAHNGFLRLCLRFKFAVIRQFRAERH